MAARQPLEHTSGHSTCVGHWQHTRFDAHQQLLVTVIHTLVSSTLCVLA